MEQHLKYIAEQIREIEDIAKDAQATLWWDEYLKVVQKRVNEVKDYAVKNNIPIILDAEVIAERNYQGGKFEEDEDESSSYYEEESSSYYEDEDEDE